ncbi:MAG TPA: acyltransferase [Gemmataceae bacterium]|nr:acyltransferase [Gemmataceae bacterium]
MTQPLPAAFENRLQFLDVLRGIAALVVVLEHGFAVCIPHYLDFSIRYFDLGQFGVTLFLLVSGFIIPVTLERGGSVRRFWVNRFFRLFPLYWTTIAFFWLYYHLCAPASLHPKESWQWLMNLTMCQEFMRVPHVTTVFWTLTLELIFYALCSLLYPLGLFRRTWNLIWLGQAGLIALGIGFPLATGRRFPGGYAVLLLTMFVGTMFRQWTTGQISRRRLLWSLASLAPISLAVSYVCFALFQRTGYPLTFHCVWLVWASAYACFVGLLSCRARAMPSWLCYCGRISYSIYLIHTCLVLILPHEWPRVLYLGTLLGGTLALSALTYHYIENPCIRLGRRLLGKPRLAGLPTVLPIPQAARKAA